MYQTREFWEDLFDRWLRKGELKVLCEYKGLIKGGKKQDLIERLLNEVESDYSIESIVNLFHKEDLIEYSRLIGGRASGNKIDILKSVIDIFRDDEKEIEEVLHYDIDEEEYEFEPIPEEIRMVLESEMVNYDEPIVIRWENCDGTECNNKRWCETLSLYNESNVIIKIINNVLTKVLKIPDYEIFYHFSFSYFTPDVLVPEIDLIIEAKGPRNDLFDAFMQALEYDSIINNERYNGITDKKYNLIYVENGCNRAFYQYKGSGGRLYNGSWDRISFEDFKKIVRTITI